MYVCVCFFFFFVRSIEFNFFNLLSFFAIRRHPPVDVEEFGFLEKIFSKTQPEETTWAKLVNLKTIHWYCDGPEPTPTALKYEAKIRKRKFVIFTLFARS